MTKYEDEDMQAMMHKSATLLQLYAISMGFELRTSGRLAYIVNREMSDIAGYELEMGTGRAARGPARAGPGLKIQARGPYGPKRAKNFLLNSSQ